MEALFSELTAETNARAEARNQPAEDTRFGAYGRASAPPNGRAYPDAAPVDELFGPMVDLPAEDESEATPIYEAVASAWFQEDAVNDGAADWESPGDREWRAAAERATHQPEDVTFTAEGLPRRRAGARLVPPRLSDGGVGGGVGAGGGGGGPRPSRRRPRHPPTASPTASASASPPTSADCARAGTAPSRSTPAIPPPGSRLLLVVPNRPVVAPRG